VALEDSNGDAVALEISSADAVVLGLLARMVTLELLSQMVVMGLLGADTVAVVGVAWVFIALARANLIFF
jgi:hypothetical protein